MDMDIDGVLPPGVVLPPGGGDFFANFFSLSFFENFGKLWKTLENFGASPHLLPKLW